MRKLLVGLAAGLAFPAGANAADSVYLSLDASRVVRGWTLGGSVMSARDYAATDILGLTLRRELPGGHGDETHALRAHHERSTILFDGRTGRWRTTGQVGSVAVADMAIEATGPGAPVGELLGCKGKLTRTAVRLTGTLVLRTGTRFFATIRRARLTGRVTRATAPLDCRPAAAAAVCGQSATLYAGGPQASLSAARRSLVLQFSEALRVTSQGTVNWYHVLHVDDYDALTGAPPRLTATAASNGPARGRATFTARSTSETTSAGCRHRTTELTSEGSFRVAFTAWGARTLRLGPSTYAIYRETL